MKAYAEHLSPSVHKFVLATTKLSRLQTQTHALVSTLFPRLAPQLSHVSPESRHFVKTVDDIIALLERSASEEAVIDCEDMCRWLERLTLGGRGGGECVPVFSPQVVLCSAPQHSLEQFQDKVCTLLQLLLPDLTVSLANTISQASDELELVLKRIVLANSSEVKAARKCPV